MPISSILKRASSYIMGSESDQIDCELKYSDNEILFCKNNVCVHPPTIARQDYDIIHHPGYLTITTKTFTDQFNNAKRPTLFLNWIPNTTLRKCPSTIENNVTDELKLRFTENKSSNEPVFHSTNPFLVQYATEQSYPLIGSDGSKFAQKLDLSMAGSTLSDHSESLSISSNSDKQSTNSNEYSTHIVIPNPRNDDSEHQIQSPINDKIPSGIEPEISELQPLLADQIRKDDIVIEDKFIRSHSMTSVNITIANPCIENVDITPDNERFMRSLSLSSYDESSPNWMSTPEQLAMKHNLAFPESVTASPVISRKTPMKCRRFTVDLSQMRSLRLFFNDEQCTCGQLVVASRESQYKILHFHHGGLDHMAQVLHQWHSLLHNIRLTPGAEDSNLPYRHFMVCRPDISTSELHPEEGNIPKITADMFYGQLMNERGQIEDDLALRKGVFFGGLEKSLRKIVWPFLLHCFTYCSTYEDREFLIEIRRQEYEELTRRRLHELLPEESAHFWRTVQCVVERDVVRTDRANPFYAGEGNPNIDTLKEILLNYAVYNPGLGYTQGMSDLLAPVLCELRSASQAFWSFAGLMQRAIFVATPTDNDIDRNLNYLRELLRIMVPNFYIHLQKHTDAMELLFCHRWILLCFKREFTEAVALRMWEACWSNYLTDYFHLFLCLAIIAVYADDVIAQDLRTDEMLLHFSSLAMYMDGSLILRKARGLLHEFRQLSRIPCTLAGMCRRCGPGMWDSAHHPAIECVGHGGPGGAEQCHAE